MKVSHFGNATNARAHIVRHHRELKEAAAEQPPTPANQRTLHHFVSKLPANSEWAKKTQLNLSPVLT